MSHPYHYESWWVEYAIGKSKTGHAANPLLSKLRAMTKILFQTSLILSPYLKFHGTMTSAFPPRKTAGATDCFLSACNVAAYSRHPVCLQLDVSRHKLRKQHHCYFWSLIEQQELCLTCVPVAFSQRESDKDPSLLRRGSSRHTRHAHSPHQHARVSFCWLSCFRCVLAFLKTSSPTQKRAKGKHHGSHNPFFQINSPDFFFLKSVLIIFGCVFWVLLHLQTLTHSVILHSSHTT